MSLEQGTKLLKRILDWKRREFQISTFLLVKYKFFKEGQPVENDEK